MRNLHLAGASLALKLVFSSADLSSSKYNPSRISGLFFWYFPSNRGYHLEVCRNKKHLHDEVFLC